MAAAGKWSGPPHLVGADGGSGNPVANAVEDLHAVDVVSGGVVREFHPEEGWGVIDGPDVPGGCWVHFSAIAADGYRQLTPGANVQFRAEAAGQDGFGYRAVKVWTGRDEPSGAQPQPSDAYRSSVQLTLDVPDERGT
jgi:CspA family cold shock protein